MDAVVENGIWVPGTSFDLPINLGAHCAKGASVREHGHGEYRLRYPMKLVNGKYERISWDTALNEITAKMKSCAAASGPDSVYFVGLVQTQQRAGLPAAQVRELLGHQQLRPPGTHLPLHHRGGRGEHLGLRRHDQFVQRHAKQQGRSVHRLQCGRGPSGVHAAHAARQGNRLQDDRGRPALHPHRRQGRRVRAHPLGHRHPFLFGLLYHIFKNGWEDKKYINDRVYGMDKVRDEVMAKWTPDKVEEACGVKEDQMFKVAKMLHDNNPGTIVWCMGRPSTPSATPWCAHRASRNWPWATLAKSGGGTNIFRGHDNVQGATDVGPNPDSLPGYYGPAEGLEALRQRHGGVDFEWIKKQYASPAMMTKNGITVSRWIDGVLENNELIDQDSNLRGVFFWGHAPNSQTRGLEMKRAMDKLDLLVVVDPVSIGHRRHGRHAGQGRGPEPQPRGVPAASGHAVRDQRIVHGLQPFHPVAREGDRAAVESRSDHMIMYQFAQKLGFADELVKNYKMQKVKGMDEPVPEDILREINKSVWTIGYTGQSPNA